MSLEEGKIITGLQKEEEVQEEEKLTKNFTSDFSSTCVTPVAASIAEALRCSLISIKNWDFNNKRKCNDKKRKKPGGKQKNVRESSNLGI
ncbi:hypothetical protein CEXT_585871 [Caerostris extrusa]|uniref:Uncharacterized protein n=1 Tax=Caerostris extrusa TaxID=172846 RepID=A0AAV4T815_CAEEX|nr:hypothetical protein CEXT_585871 [Caerostris extrusa]